MTTDSTDDTTDDTTDPVDLDAAPDDEPEVSSASGNTPGTTEGEVEDQDAEDGGRQGREAAKYRRRLRAVEAERDQLAQRLEAMQRAEVDRQAEAAQLKPAALWSAAQLADLLNEDGTVDTDKVDTAIQAARSVLGLPQPKHNYVPREGSNVTAAAARTSIDGMVNAVMGRSD